HHPSLEAIGIRGHDEAPRPARLFVTKFAPPWGGAPTSGRAGRALPVLRTGRGPAAGDPGGNYPDTGGDTYRNHQADRWFRWGGALPVRLLHDRCQAP